MSLFHTGAPHGVQKHDKDTFIFREVLVKEEFITEIDESNKQNEIRKLTCLQPQCHKVFTIKSGSSTGNIYKDIRKMHPGIPVTREEAESLRAIGEAESSQNTAYSSSTRGDMSKNGLEPQRSMRILANKNYITKILESVLQS